MRGRIHRDSQPTRPHRRQRERRQHRLTTQRVQRFCLHLLLALPLRQPPLLPPARSRRQVTRLLEQTTPIALPPISATIWRLHQAVRLGRLQAALPLQSPARPRLGRPPTAHPRPVPRPATVPPRAAQLPQRRPRLVQPTLPARALPRKRRSTFGRSRGRTARSRHFALPSGGRGCIRLIILA